MKLSIVHRITLQKEYKKINYTRLDHFFLSYTFLLLIEYILFLRLYGTNFEFLIKLYLKIYYSRRWGKSWWIRRYNWWIRSDKRISIDMAWQITTKRSYSSHNRTFNGQHNDLCYSSNNRRFWYNHVHYFSRYQHQI